MLPAPYMARIHWVAAQRWDAMRNAEWEAELTAAHAITLGKLPTGIRAMLAMPVRAREKLIPERRSCWRRGGGEALRKMRTGKRGG